MKTRIAVLAVCGAMLLSAQADNASAQNQNPPVPGIDVVVKAQCPPTCPKLKQSGTAKPTKQAIGNGPVQSTGVGLDIPKGRMAKPKTSGDTKAKR